MLRVWACFTLARVLTPSSPVREREKVRERKREGERERDVEYDIFIFKRNDGCLGTF
jgi:hypothetical protein